MMVILQCFPCGVMTGTDDDDHECPVCGGTMRVVGRSFPADVVDLRDKD